MAIPSNDLINIASENAYQDGYYAGYANKVVLNSGTQVQGIFPGTFLPAENINSQFNNQYEWLNYDLDANEFFGDRGNIVAFDTFGDYNWFIPDNARFLEITVVGGGGDGGSSLSSVVS